MKRIAFVLVAAIVLSASATEVARSGPRERYEARLGQPARAHRFAGHLGYQWKGQPSGIAGTTVYDRGELIHQDRPFDDTGADRTADSPITGAQPVYEGLCGAGGAYRHGEFTYPEHRAYADNAADLVELRLASSGDRHHALFVFQTLISLDTTAAELRIESGTTEHAVTVTGRGAALDGDAVAHHVDLDANTIETAFPRRAVGEGPWRVSLVTGTAQAGSDDKPMLATPVDLAFVDEPIVEEFNCWHDKVQSAAIASGDHPEIEVDPSDLRRGRSDTAAVPRGPMVRLHVPSQDLGEGIVPQQRYDQSTANVYLGTYQPYAVYLPDSYDPRRPNPLIVLLHCLNCNHNTFHIAAWPGLRKLAEARGAPIVTPLAYGEAGHYEGEAELDVFDVIDDVSARYRIDRDRIYLTGMSMGALGTYRLGLLHPDVWARAVGIGNYTNPFCVTPSQKHAAGCGAAPFNYFSILQNARNLPFGVLNGALDELTPVTGAREIADRFGELGYTHRYWEFLSRRHEPGLHGAAADVLNPFLGDARRLTRPASVTYALDREMDRDSAPFGIVHDRAYWVRDIRLSDGARFASVDATAGRGQVLKTEPEAGDGESDAGPYTMRGLAGVVREVSGPNELELVLSSVASVRVATGDSSLSPAEPLRLSVKTDNDVDVSVDGFSGPGAVPAGEHEFVLEPVAPGKSGVVRAAHPPTGGGAGATPSLPPFALLLVLALGVLASHTVRRTAAGT